MTTGFYLTATGSRMYGQRRVGHGDGIHSKPLRKKQALAFFASLPMSPSPYYGNRKVKKLSHPP